MKDILVRWIGFGTRGEDTVQIERIEDSSDGPVYEVTLDGEVIGTVYRRSITVERKSKGNTYVNSRYTSKPRYWGQSRHRTMDYRTRQDALAEMVRDYRRKDEK